MPTVTVETIIMCSHTVKERRRLLTDDSEAQIVAHLLVGNTISGATLRPQGIASRLRLRPANLRWSHCSLCQVLSVAVKPTSAKMTVMEPWRRVSH